jgi:hypothetical protein
MHVENEPPRNTFRYIVSAHLRLRCDYLLHDRRRMSEPYEGITFQKKGNGLYNIRGSKKPLELLLLPVILQGKYGNVYGLWLQATGKHRGQYRRIGVFVHEYISDFCEGGRIAGSPAEDWEYSHIEIDEHGKQRKFIDLV